MKVTGDRLNMQEVLGRRVSRLGALHLVEGKNSTQQDWLTLCGRKIPLTTVLIPEKFKGGRACCSVCIIMENRKKPNVKRVETRL